MTVDRGIPPTMDAYNAAIFACACSGNKLYVGEAFRLAKEMIDGNGDAYGKPGSALGILRRYGGLNQPLD